ncbi:MAG: FHA domain-containing protein [Gemmatimonadetes bacterium]|nr:FHA domain-containing protein [Gemmatimonadota bacterium]
MLGKRKSVATCPAGHPQEDTWERCPFCEAERLGSDGARQVTAEQVALADSSADSGGATRVSRRAPGTRPLAGWLVVLGGEQEGRDFRVEVGRNWIGKGGECDVLIKDAHVSERHAVLEIAEDGSRILRDLDSKYGTFVDETRVRGERAVNDGDHIRVGNTELRFRSYE